MRDLKKRRYLKVLFVRKVDFWVSPPTNTDSKIHFSIFKDVYWALKKLRQPFFFNKKNAVRTNERWSIAKIWRWWIKLWVGAPSIVSYVKKFNIVRHKLRVRRGSSKFRAWQEAPEGSTGAPVLSAAAPEPQSGAEWGSEPLQEEPEPEGRYLWVGYFHLSSLFLFLFFFHTTRDMKSAF